VPADPRHIAVDRIERCLDHALIVHMFDLLHNLKPARKALTERTDREPTA
jgi:hypothetical protein